MADPSLPDTGPDTESGSDSDPRAGPDASGAPGWRPSRDAALAPGLYLVATPIGNLRDVTLRALDVLASATRVYAEDQRQTLKLLNAFGIRARLGSYHEHNAEAAREEILAALASGASAALVSDAGTPLVSDPGFKLVRAAAAAGHRVIPVPGASAALAGLVASGLPTDRFLFAGFPPAKAAARAAWLTELAGIEATLVFFETGPRLAESLKDMAAVLGDRPGAVGRELTKLFEEFRRGRLSELAAGAGEAPKGEIVVVVGPPEAAAIDWSEIEAALRGALAHDSVRDAAAKVAAAYNVPRKDVYALALKLKAP
ncbi:MAG: 16S rRNA (cytidine(1402)-2'-O)-methyltransferase [Hyphomonadaceae bacterium]|nr:16S rRNA (cytidine(1402)-2'-O)-methyltransferase [Hyphomonadaceae bacterium]